MVEDYFEQALQDTRGEIRRVLRQLAEMGFPIVTLYHFYSAVLNYRRAEFKVDSPEWEEFDPYDPTHLIATLCYQHDDETRKKHLSRPFFPDKGSPTYMEIMSQMMILGAWLSHLRDFIPNTDEYAEYLDVLDETPSQVVEYYSQRIYHQLYIRENATEEEVLGEIVFHLKHLLARLNKARLHGDEVPDETMDEIENQYELANQFFYQEKFDDATAYFKGKYPQNNA